MKALVIGQGGREHALVRALSLSPSVTAVFAISGSDGISNENPAKVKSVAIDWKNTEAVQQLVQREGISFVVVGPEIPLVDGMSDRLRELGIPVVGPSREAARLEGSKVYSKEFMIAAGVPTARSHTVASVAETREAAQHYQPPFVLKADGLAAGKGVFICKTEDELLEAARSLFEERVMGDAGSSALLEEFQPGYEISFLILTNGSQFEPLVLAQDHKRIGDGDTGPNTGGMGVVAPVEIDTNLRNTINTKIIEPTLKELQKRSLLYRGILYVGLMITPNGPSVIEYNARFGDPETQVILPLLDGDWGQVFAKVAAGQVEPLKWKKGAAACVVLAAEGYPDSPKKGVAIEKLATATSSATSYFLHAGTKKKDGVWVTDGGRVLNSVGLGENLRAALNAAYVQAEQATWSGRQMRRDIGAKLL
jgi:phosphoribosylamine---glycine ligase